MEAAGDHVTLMHDPQAAVQGVDLVTTHVWASMGQEEEQAKREADFAGFQVTETMLDQAQSDGTAFLHCLPAHRGEEISHTLLDYTLRGGMARSWKPLTRAKGVNRVFTAWPD